MSTGNLYEYPLSLKHIRGYNSTISTTNRLEIPLYYAYLDESGNVAPFQASERFLAVAVVACNHAASRSLELHVKRMRKKAQIKIDGELKATSATETQKTRLLEALTDEDIAIIAVILNKGSVYRKPKDPEDWYREVASLAAWYCADYCSTLRLILDKRYTKTALRDKLESSVWDKLGELSPRVQGIEQLDSRSSLGLQAVDFVAWAMRQHYEFGDHRYYEIVKKKIVKEVVIEAK
jgi:hypothetical protein